MKILTFERAILFLFLISIFIVIKSMLNYQSMPITSEADIVVDKLTSEGEISLLNSNEIDEEKVRMLAEMDYTQIKGMLGIENDFCIYFEDENSNLIKIDNLNYGIGSGNIHINGVPCE